MLTGWKTLIFSVGVALFGVAQAADWTHIISNPQTAGYVVTGIGVLAGVLRMFTSTPVGSKVS